MSNAAVITLSWLAVAAHVFIGIVAWRRGSALPLVPAVNLTVALCVVAYWVREWWIIFTRGIIWHGTDQLLPAYAVVVCIVSVLALTGRIVWGHMHWTIFAAHTLVSLAAALFFSTFRITRLF